MRVNTDDDYQSFVDKYASVRTDFETHMTESCKVSKNISFYEQLYATFLTMQLITDNSCQI